MRQPLVAPTSMYSMKRSTMPLPRKWRAIGTHLVVVDAALHDHVDLDRRQPAASAASMPASTSATGKSASFMRRNTASSSASRLTVTLDRPAAFSALALRASSEPLVVSVTSSGRHRHCAARISIATNSSMCRRSSGSPPVNRSLVTPCAANTRARRVISSKLSSDVLRQELVVAIEHRFGHAVAATKVAAIGHRNAQVAQRPVRAGRSGGPWAHATARGWRARPRHSADQPTESRIRPSHALCRLPAAAAEVQTCSGGPGFYGLVSMATARRAPL